MRGDRERGARAAEASLRHARTRSATAGEAFAPLYGTRFDDDDLQYKRKLWSVLVADFFQRYVDEGDTLVELGAGHCEFLNAIRCRRKIAVDVNPATADAATGAEVLLRPSDDLSPVASASVDVVFASNFFEHLETKDALLATLRECRRVCRRGAKLVVLQPNIRYLPGRYWDYLDHHIPLTHMSMVEALELTGFRPQEVLPKFLPYTVKGRHPRSLFLVRAYLRLRPAWNIFGRQMLIVAVRQ